MPLPLRIPVAGRTLFWVGCHVETLRGSRLL